MYELLYCSIGNSDLTSNDISDILQVSRKENLQNGITGCLLYFDKQFIQLIEGDKQTVKNLFSNILKDSRHANAIVLAENEKENRFFNHWSMAFAELSSIDMDNIDKVLLVSNFITFQALNHKLTKATRLFCRLAKEPFRNLTLIADNNNYY